METFNFLEKQMTKDEIISFIREKLTINGEKLRFDMSGYESKTGENVTHNQMVLNQFAYLGIYDYTFYLFLDFYKGNPCLFYKHWVFNAENMELDFCGYSTSEIIFEIFKVTLFSGIKKRRRI